MFALGADEERIAWGIDLARATRAMQDWIRMGSASAPISLAAVIPTSRRRAI